MLVAAQLVGSLLGYSSTFGQEVLPGCLDAHEVRVIHDLVIESRRKRAKETDRCSLQATFFTVLLLFTLYIQLFDFGQVVSVCVCGLFFVVRMDRVEFRGTKLRSQKANLSNRGP